MNPYQITFMSVLLMITTAAFSQGDETFTRKGFVFGASIGGGTHFLDDNTYGRFTAPNIKVGAMVNPKLAILLLAPGGTYQKGDKQRAFEGLIPTAQYWLTDKFYVNAGVGLAIETTPFYKVDYAEGPPEFNTGLGFTASVGQEIFQWSHNKTADLQLRLLYGNIEFEDLTHTNNLAIDFLIGFNLY
jgi:hypothetical protein